MRSPSPSSVLDCTIGRSFPLSVKLTKPRGIFKGSFMTHAHARTYKHTYARVRVLLSLMLNY